MRLRQKAMGHVWYSRSETLCYSWEAFPKPRTAKPDEGRSKQAAVLEKASSDEDDALH